MFVSAIFATLSLTAQELPNLPKTLHAGPFKAGHIQGIAVDTKQEFIYLSFTTMLVKMDMKGNVIGSVTGLLGHLGCLEFNDEDGRLYGSLEYKNDAIGKGILKQEGSSKQLETGFYVAIFDVDKIVRKGMNAERDGVMTTVLLKTIVKDYFAKVKTKSGEIVEHRHGCSGFDGISFGPAFDGSGKTMLTVAYGIYGDTKRTDNDTKFYCSTIQRIGRNMKRLSRKIICTTKVRQSHMASISYIQAIQLGAPKISNTTRAAIVGFWLATQAKRTPSQTTLSLL